MKSRIGKILAAAFVLAPAAGLALFFLREPGARLPVPPPPAPAPEPPAPERNPLLGDPLPDAGETGEGAFRKAGNLRWHLALRTRARARTEGDNAPTTVSIVFHPPAPALPAPPSPPGAPGLGMPLPSVGRTETIVRKSGPPTRRWRHTLVEIPVDVVAANETYRALRLSDEVPAAGGRLFTLRVEREGAADSPLLVHEEPAPADLVWRPAERKRFGIAWSRPEGIEPGTYLVRLEPPGAGARALEARMEVE